MWLDGALASLAVLALVQAAMLFQVRRKLQLLQQGMGTLAHNMAHAGNDVPTSMLVAALGRIEKRLGELESPQGKTMHAYDLAQQMARDGADVEQLVARCGLSRDEARLVRQLYPLDRSEMAGR